MAERNAEVAPDKRIEFRVGIHLGDVVEESEGDLMGDGVNIAGRRSVPSDSADRSFDAGWLDGCDPSGVARREPPHVSNPNEIPCVFVVPAKRKRGPMSAIDADFPWHDKDREAQGWCGSAQAR
jgi:hypothetical protein